MDDAPSGEATVDDPRPYQPADRPRALRLLGDAGAIDSPGNRVVVSPHGVAIWHDEGGEAELGAIAMDGGGLVDFYRLIARCARDAIDRGYRRAFFTLHDARLLARIRRDFEVEPRPIGYRPNTEQPLEWEVRVDLEDALRQVGRYVDA